MYNYQVFEILRWMVEEKIGTESSLSLARAQVQDQSKPTWLRSYAFALLGQFGDDADFATIVSEFPRTSTDLQQAIVLCSLKKQTPMARNAFYARFGSANLLTSLWFPALAALTRYAPIQRAALGKQTLTACLPEPRLQPVKWVPGSCLVAASCGLPTPKVLSRGSDESRANRWQQSTRARLLSEVRGTPQRNLAVDLLQKLIRANSPPRGRGMLCRRARSPRCWSRPFAVTRTGR